MSKIISSRSFLLKSLIFLKDAKTIRTLVVSKKLFWP